MTSQGQSPEPTEKPRSWAIRVIVFLSLLQIVGSTCLVLLALSLVRPASEGTLSHLQVDLLEAMGQDHRSYGRDDVVALAVPLAAPGLISLLYLLFIGIRERRPVLAVLLLDALYCIVAPCNLLFVAVIALMLFRPSARAHFKGGGAGP